MKARRYGLIAAALGLAAGSMLLAGVLMGGETPAGRTTQPEFTTPCLGSETSLAAARDAAGFIVIEPQASLANSQRLKSVWRCTTVADGIALVYDSGITILESPNDLEDPMETWQKMADSYEEFSMGEVAGIPASFADPAVGEATGIVDFVEGDVRYRVNGDGEVPLDQLIGVAKSVVGALK